jgi:hypothetical protein
MRKALASIVLCVPAALAAPDARADGKPFVDVPLTLPPLHFGGEAGIGFGTYQTTNVTVGTTGASTSSTSTHVGWGSNFDAAIGLPFLGEIGARVGYRFGADGVAAYANHYARLFDPIMNEPGQNNFDNVEMHLRGSIVSVEVFELGLETRIVIPTDSKSVVAFTPGVPIRIHIPDFMRIDTGLWLSIPSESNNFYYILDIPAQAYFQLGDAFVGPQTGIRFTNPAGGAGGYAEVPLGVGGGYTFGGVLDIMAQLRTEHINSSPSQLGFGGGLGLGIRVP